MQEKENTSNGVAGFSCEFRNAVESISSVISSTKAYIEPIQGAA